MASAKAAWLLPLTSELAALPLVGGKGENLARLARAGFPVPGGYILTTQAYRAFVALNNLAAAIQNALPAGAPTPTACEEAASQIRARFCRGLLPDEWAAQIIAAYADLGRPPVAVRSSATAEDLPEMSFAGQQDTYLNVIGDDALLTAVIDCWSSLWTPRAISYRARNQIPHADIALAVIIQQMVESQASGVLFTANPLTGLRAETVINATVGLGEALVAGQVDPDNYVVDTRSGQIISRTLGAKALSVRSQPGGGTVTVNEAGCRDEASPRPQALPDAQIQALAALGQQVAQRWGAPQDIEWAWADGALHLLQTRPITSLFPTPVGMPPEPLVVMASFGAVQGMLDPITPLGRDTLMWILVAGARLLGITLAAETQRTLFVAGERLWINLTPVLRNTIGRQIMPAVSRFVDPAAGEILGAIWEDAQLQPARRGISRRAGLQLARLMLPVAGNIWLNLLAPHHRRRLIVDRGERILETFAAACAESTFAGDAYARLARLARLAPTLLATHVPRAFRLFASGVASGIASFNLVRTLAQNLDGTSTDQILGLTRGLPNNPTTEMDLALWQVAEAVRADAASQSAFQNQPAAALAAAYHANALPATAQQALAAFMVRYGSRGLAEIDLGRPRWSEEPAQVIKVVAGYLQITDAAQAPDAAFRRGAAAAAADIDALAAAARRGRGGLLRARLIRLAASRARALMALRESPKFFMVRVLGIFRAALLRTGQELVTSGALARPDDLCYLSFSELEAFAAGAPADWRSLITARREAYQREVLRRQAPRLLLSDGRAFYTGIQAPGSAALFGSPVSPGSAEGSVRVVHDPRHADLLPGEIMVCRGTDPSWTPLFLTAGGLIMEVGGLMTHGAVVAREYGLPAVVGVDRATERLQTGQQIALNGSTGEIRELA